MSTINTVSTQNNLSDQQTVTTDKKHFVELKHVTKRFGSNIVIDSLNLAIPKGEMVTLLGPSGCGKTTVLRLVAGLEKPSGGQIFIDGEDVTDAFMQGAQRALEYLKQRHITHVILKANSPSCGSGLIYSGRFDSTLKTGSGVATALFEANGITVWHEEHPELTDWIAQILRGARAEKNE